MPQVRPRPPSDGRPRMAGVRPVAPSPTRLARHRRIERRRGLPLPLKFLLAASILAAGLAIVWVGSGSVGPFVAGVANGFGGLLTKFGAVVASPAPTPSEVLADAPSIVPPDEPYTNVETVDVTVNVPVAVVGNPDYAVRLWVTVPDAQPTIAAEVPVGPTAELTIPGVTLAKGRNDFQASVVGPSGEGDLSTVATWVLDLSKPKVTVISPADNASTSKDTITIKGKTQARSSVLVRNEANNATAAADADSAGLFQVQVAVVPGTNAITITATDPAGNANSSTLTVRRASGRLLVNLTGTAYRFKASKLPKDVTFTVAVTGPDGKRLAGATVLFTVSVPGLEAIVSSELTTDANGTAAFSTRIPKGAMAGGGLATVLVTTTDVGQATDRQVLTVE